MDRLTFPFTVGDAVDELHHYIDEYKLLGNPETQLNRFVALKDLDETTGDAATWRRDGRHVSGSFGLLITPNNFTGPKSIGPVIACDNPHRAFFTLMWLVYGKDYEPDPPVEFNHFQMGMGSRIVSSNPSKTYLEVVVGDGCVVTNTTIYDTAVVGNNCTIGTPGFGHVPEMGVALAEGERRWRVPHIGRVVIEDDVDIGDNTVINRGCLGDTIIRRGAKIDSHVFIAHNVEIGEDAVVVAGAIICGSAKIGKGAWIAAGACVRNGVTVGEGATVGLMANVVKDVPAGTTVMGNPARVV